jgi:hypothetical protein
VQTRPGCDPGRRAVDRWLRSRKRDLHILLVNLGCGPVKPAGAAGVAALGHRAYVGREWDVAGNLQFRFLCAQGLRPNDVLCDIGCGALRAGRHLVPYLDRGHYLGLDAVRELVARGLECEVGPALVAEKTPEFVISEQFEFQHFSRPATVALAVSLFTHLDGGDIVTCLTRLGRWMGGGRSCYATFFEVSKPVRNYRRSHPHLGFHYTFAEMAAFGERSGWESRYVGDWSDVVGRQMMIRYVSAGPKWTER